MLRWFVFLVYFVVLAALKNSPIYKDSADPSDDFKRKCGLPISGRLINDFWLIVLPCNILAIAAFFVYFCCFTKNIKEDPKKALNCLRLSQNLMLLKMAFFLIGTTVWGIRNIVTMIILTKRNCVYMGRGQTMYEFWLINFVIFSVISLIISILMLVVLPVVMLIRCYSETNRVNDNQNPFTHITLRDRNAKNLRKTKTSFETNS